MVDWPPTGPGRITTPRLASPLTSVATDPISRCRIAGRPYRDYIGVAAGCRARHALAMRLAGESPDMPGVVLASQRYCRQTH
jgi:hypothetical protein